MFFSKLFARADARPSFSPDLPGDERVALAREMADCADRRGGSLKNARRAQALAALFDKLSPAGKQVYVEVIEELNQTCRQAPGDRYSEIEETELFGGSGSKLGILDLFETPRRRLLSRLCETERGTELLGDIRLLASPETAEDISIIIQQ